MGGNMLFVYNPRAGKARIRSNLLDIIDVFVKAGYEVTAYPTQAHGDAVKAVRERRTGYDIVVCSGGDGTLDEVVTGMMQCEEKLPIGYVPAGSTNDFANSLGIPRTMIKAADVVVNGENFGCDIGSFNNDSFVYVAAFGIFTDVSYATKQDMKNLLGHTAYLVEGVKRLSSIKSYPMKITYNDVCLEEDYIYGMITNSVSVGGFKGITGKDIKLDDGLFEVTLIKRPNNPLELNNIIAALVDKRIHSEAIHCFKTSKLVIESEQEVAWSLDGEYGGDHKKAVIENCRQALQIRIPQEVKISD
ncbi:MAG: YegS/Rv2252/BmrU family lipid kinase [Bacillus sp. (in: Bacteria)]|nr:YegS/Rv2252/BmrU family lipid kinase [Bacillus sp. (in: firmicutes)]MCM1425035.1 YegS/Rv2252/BmrU family lipid kinase [Eubacterium sp.]